MTLPATQAKFEPITVHTFARVRDPGREKYQTIAANGNSTAPAARSSGAGMFSSGSTIPAVAIIARPVVPLTTASATSTRRTSIEEMNVFIEPP